MEGLAEHSAYLMEVGEAARVVLLIMAWVAVGEVPQKAVLRLRTFPAWKVHVGERKQRLMLEALG